MDNHTNVSESQLPKLTYGELAKIMGRMSDAELVYLLDSKSIKVGDTAASLLSSRHKLDLIKHCVLSDKVTTRKGKMRCSFILNCHGCAAKATNAYLHLLNDKNPDVISGALFGLVFLQDKTHLPVIEEAAKKVPPGTTAATYFEDAIRALKKENPFLFAPGFKDDANVWELKKEN